jgi:hypothetical protein
MVHGTNNIQGDEVARVAPLVSVVHAQDTADPMSGLLTNKADLAHGQELHGENDMFLVFAEVR